MVRQAERDGTRERREEGLSDGQVLASREAHGSNRLTRQKSKPFWRQFLGNLNDPVIRILLAALAVNLLLLLHSADWVETAGIGLAVFLATLISTLSERSSERAFARLSEEGERATCRVRRGGRVHEIPLAEVVVGDIVLLGAGESVPADGLLLHGAARVNQSAMTGESREIDKRAWSGPAAGLRSYRAEPSDPCAPIYLDTISRWSHGRYSMSVPAYLILTKSRTAPSTLSLCKPRYCPMPCAACTT